MTKETKKESLSYFESAQKEAPHENGDTSSPKKSETKNGSSNKHKRSATLDNAYLLEGGVSLDHSDLEDRRSLPSLEHLDEDPHSVLIDEGLPPELLEVLANPSIEDDSPAAEALRANAEIRVRKVGKLARRVHGQTVRRVVKRATLRSKSGRVRGKPPRIPPAKQMDAVPPTGPEKEIYVVHEGDESEELGEEEEMDSSLESSEDDADYKHSHDDEAGLFVAASGDRPTHSDEEVATTGDEDVVVDKVPDWTTRLTEGADTVPAEVLTGTVDTGKKGEIFRVFVFVSMPVGRALQFLTNFFVSMAL